MWLAFYVSLSRPRSFGQLLSHGLPDRSIIESGPPQELAKAFDELFTEKIAATKIAVVEPRVMLEATKEKSSRKSDVYEHLWKHSL